MTSTNIEQIREGLKSYCQPLQAASPKQQAFAEARRAEWLDSAAEWLNSAATAAGEDVQKVRILAFANLFLCRQAEHQSARFWIDADSAQMMIAENKAEIFAQARSL